MGYSKPEDLSSSLDNSSTSPIPSEAAPALPGKWPAVSIVLAACNGEQYIAAQLESILCQMEEEDELLISIDPSRDRTKEIVQDIQARYPDQSIYVQNGPGSGVIDNFESILALAANPVVVLADQDDCWHKNRLARIRQEFAKDDKLEAIVCDARICDAKGKTLAPSYFKEHGTKAGYWNNLIRNSFIGCCMALRKEVVDQALPFEKPLPMHDQYLGLLAYRMGYVLFLPEALVDYRRHGNNATSLKPSSLADQMRWRLWIYKAVSKAARRKTR